MKLFRSSTRALSITLEGLKEALMAVAERVTRRIQVAKLQFQADDAEARLRQAYESLGQCLYTTHTAQTPETLKVIDVALPVCESIRAEQRTLQTIRDRLASQYDEDALTVLLIRRDESLLFPHAETVLKAGDQVTLVGRRSAMPAALQSLRA